MVSRGFGILEMVQQPLVVATKNAFNSLIEEYGNDNNQLLFSFMELIDIHHSGISQTRVCSNGDDIKSIKQLYNDHQSLLNACNNIHNDIFSYVEWYSKIRCYKGINIVEDSSIIKNTFNWAEHLCQKNKTQFGYRKGLSDNTIENFIVNYMEGMNRLILHQFPHTLSIMLPILGIFEDNVEPLAYIQIHIGTKNEIPMNSIEELVSRCKSLWYQQYGGYSVKSLSKNLSDYHLNNEQLSHFMLSNPNENGLQLNALITSYLSLEINFQSFYKMKNIFLLKLENANNKGSLDVFGTLRDIPSVNNLIRSFNVSYVPSFILRRAYVIFLLVSKNMEVSKVREYILNDENREKVMPGTKVTATQLTYFNNYLHLTVKDDLGFYKDLKRYILTGSVDVLHPKEIKKLEEYKKGLTAFEIEVIQRFG